MNMPIATTPEIDNLVESLYRSGEYASRVEVIEKALHLLQRRRELSDLLQIGIEQLDAGEYVEYGVNERERLKADIASKDAS
jgi:Arc/MetJ-type ribon-helix-helix transcriptional regulator